VSVLVVGLSHKTAPVATLERAAVGGDTLDKLLKDVAFLPDVAETFVISTCNRVEVYADVDRFHGGVSGICRLLAQYSAVAEAELTPSLYVHYEDRAAQHLLAVASGLDSMVVGEDQILGQVRSALNKGRDMGTIGRGLSDLGRAALRAGKRARAETGIDRLGLSVVSVGLDMALAGRDPRELDVLVVGAGAMSGLTVATVARKGVKKVVVANRTRARAERLTVAIPGAEVADLDDLSAAIEKADLVVSCTGATGTVITAAELTRRRGELTLLDLAMPHDIDPSVARLEGVQLLNMDTINTTELSQKTTDEARVIVEEEFAAYSSARRAAQVAPTVVALRAKAAELVDVELTRLASRLSGEGLTGHALEEMAQTVHRVVDKLLHAPTVRVKELAGSPGGEDYAAALRVLFDLDPRAVDAVAKPALDQEG
jgi:glutamyl-tRNA reductase